MTLLGLLLAWTLLVGLTVGPIFSAQSREDDQRWSWIVAALLLGPLAGIGYSLSRHAVRKVAEAQREPAP